MDSHPFGAVRLGTSVSIMAAVKATTVASAVAASLGLQLSNDVNHSVVKGEIKSTCCLKTHKYCTLESESVRKIHVQVFGTIVQWETSISSNAMKQICYIFQCSNHPKMQLCNCFDVQGHITE